MARDTWCPEPSGLAVDKQGRLFVCDRGNDRVKVYGADGTLLGTFDAPRPEQIAIHPATGAIYLMCRSELRGFDILRAADRLCVARRDGLRRGE